MASWEEGHGEGDLGHSERRRRVVLCQQTESPVCKCCEGTDLQQRKWPGAAEEGTAAWREARPENILLMQAAGAVCSG